MRIEARPISEAVFDAAMEAGATPLQARLLAGRLGDEQAGQIDALLTPHLKHLAPPKVLKGADRAAERISRALIAGERIGLLTDYDVDGVTSHWVLLRALRDYFGAAPSSLSSWIGHRIHDGYGISATLVDRILASPERPQVIITADCGSSDEPRIARLNEAGIDVIVGDHHAIPDDGVPSSAYCVVNPTQDDCAYPDASIAGVMVSWLLMSATRQALIDGGRLASNSPKLVGLLDAVALGTVADCVDLGGSAINRAVVQVGLQIANRFEAPFWQSVAAELGESHVPLTAETLGFQVGPRINARGRIDEPMAALYAVMAEQAQESQRWLGQLSVDNEARKVLQKAMLERCQPKAFAQVSAGRYAIVVFDPEGHPGVQGIVASRLTDATGLPAIVLAPAQQAGFALGSMRSVAGVHAKQVLADCREFLERHGGHAGAAGLMMKTHLLTDFAMAVDRAVRTQHPDRPEKVQRHDGEIDPSRIGGELWDEIMRLEPFGRGFESPTFVSEFTVVNGRVVGQDKTHLSLTLNTGGTEIRSIWFGALAGRTDWPVQKGDRARLQWTPTREVYRGQVHYRVRIEGVVA